MTLVSLDPETYESFKISLPFPRLNPSILHSELSHHYAGKALLHKTSIRDLCHTSSSCINPKPFVVVALRTILLPYHQWSEPFSPHRGISQTKTTPFDVQQQQQQLNTSYRFFSHTNNTAADAIGPLVRRRLRRRRRQEVQRMAPKKVYATTRSYGSAVAAVATPKTTNSLQEKKMHPFHQRDEP